MTKQHDVAIIGSGFSGSILAWILASQGRSVALIDAVTHPRFAIGESSTPIADLLLRRLGERYGLSALVELSTYGSWQLHHSKIACGRKRGFSYYAHSSGKPFSDTSDHQRSLLVAASAHDDVADTHWYRRDVDQFYWQQANSAGADSYVGNPVQGVEPADPHRVTLSDQRVIVADWVIDASGRAGVTARLLKQPSRVGRLTTNTYSSFAHFRGVKSWAGLLKKSGIACDEDPFDADDSAQHHLYEDGWMWMLRFNNGITSVGWTGKQRPPRPESRRYPSLDAMLAQAEVVEPAEGPTNSDRLQRLYHPLMTRRCLMLPTTACTIDPLHSTGIAHALSGVQRVAQVVLAGECQQQYAGSILAEARLLDRLVSTAYETMHDFPRFVAACTLYFTAAISCEERILAGDMPTHLWSADDDRFVNIAEACCELLLSDVPTWQAVSEVRHAISPWNDAGLLDPSVNNRYAYTATKR